MGWDLNPLHWAAALAGHDIPGHLRTRPTKQIRYRVHGAKITRRILPCRLFLPLRSADQWYHRLNAPQVRRWRRRQLFRYVPECRDLCVELPGCKLPGGLLSSLVLGRMLRPGLLLSMNILPLRRIVLQGLLLLGMALLGLLLRYLLSLGALQMSLLVLYLVVRLLGGHCRFASIRCGLRRCLQQGLVHMLTLGLLDCCLIGGSCMFCWCCCCGRWIW